MRVRVALLCKQHLITLMVIARLAVRCAEIPGRGGVVLDGGNILLRVARIVGGNILLRAAHIVGGGNVGNTLCIAIWSRAIWGIRKRRLTGIRRGGSIEMAPFSKT